MPNSPHSTQEILHESFAHRRILLSFEGNDFDGRHEDLEDDDPGVPVMGGFSYRQSEWLRWDAEFRWLYIGEADPETGHDIMHSIGQGTGSTGLGMGLAIVNQVCERMDWRFGLENRASGGRRARRYARGTSPPA
jgi:hypothetical protein